MNNLIYITEDDSSIRSLYECTFENAGFKTQCFEKAEQLFEALENKLPSIIIMDLMLPEMDGITAIGKLKANPKYKDIPVIIISANSEETVKVKGLNIGAEDYIEKPFGVLELCARVKKVLSRSINQNGIIKHKDIQIDIQKHTVKAGGKDVALTPKEFDLLVYLLSSPGNVLKRDDILNNVWGENYFTETRTLDIHIKSLRQKLGRQGDYITTVRGVGFKTD
ncbi:MAG: response regulator transcription factor [Clostridia bacterium]|nr:response regulator transcription factor [Clostridia bacterium]